MEQRFRFTKEERVTGNKRIEILFSEGRSFMAFPFRVVYLETALGVLNPLSILISVPKKRMKSAVDRNRMKRLTREAFRLNKHLFPSGVSGIDRHWDVALISVANSLCDYATIEKGIRKVLKELNHRLEEGEGDKDH